MVVEPSTGALYVASQAEKETKAGSGKFDEYAIVQKFSKMGTFEGQTEFAIGGLDNIHGLAIDPQAEKLYLLTELEQGNGFFHVADVWSISTAGGKPTFEKELVSKLGEKGFVEPAGLAVDPSHNVLVLGYQEEKSKGETKFYAALQAVHQTGTLGPRYVDKSGCLTGQLPPGETACERVTGEEDTLAGLVVTRGGYALVSAENETLWEIPDPEPSRGK